MVASAVALYEPNSCAWECHDGLPPAAATPGQPRLLDRVREAIRLRHYSRRAEKAYVGWARRFVPFHGRRHPAEMGKAEIEGLLSHLAVRERVSASTQNQALSAILFLYGEVLRREVEWLDEILRAKRPARIPLVLTQEEVRAVLDRLPLVERLMASLLYGGGLRLLECCRLRIKDLDFDRGEIAVRDGKGARGIASRCSRHGYTRRSPLTSSACAPSTCRI